MTHPIAEVLRAAADLVEKPGAWTQRVFARDATRRPVTARDRSAVCWCASGAVRHVTADWDKAGAAHEFLFQALPKWWRNRQNLTGWNDSRHRTQAEVVSALRRAADLAEAGERGE